MRSSVIVFPGSNCDRDIAVALEKMQFKNKMVWHKETSLPKTDLIVIPGGFSYGDYLRSGAIAGKSVIINEVIKAANDGCLVLGICNGFQILTETGLLNGTLLRNKNLKFINRDVNIKVINNYLNVGLTILSNVSKKRFKPFCSISFNHLNINNNFSFSNNELDLISDAYSSISRIQVFDAEIGLIFEEFKISLVKENMLKNYMFYSNDIYSNYDFTPLNNVSAYLINVIWIFKD